MNIFFIYWSYEDLEMKPKYFKTDTECGWLIIIKMTQTFSSIDSLFLKSYYELNYLVAYVLIWNAVYYKMLKLYRL